MEAASLCSSLVPAVPTLNNTILNNKVNKHNVNLISPQKCNPLIGNRRSTARIIAAINDVSAVTSPAEVEVTWQIVVGAIAGFTPFVVAGIEFSKRIIAQRRCEVCGGSGLVFREKNYSKCPECGGFLPWQSWKRVGARVTNGADKITCSDNCLTDRCLGYILGTQKGKECIYAIEY